MSYKVGKDVVEGTNKKVSYKDVKTNIHGWVDINQYLPPDFELVMIKFTDGKITYGWTVGDTWQGVLITDKTVVRSWKRKPSELLG